MISKLAHFFLAIAFLVSMGAMAQTAATPDAPSAASSSVPVASGTRIGAINVEQAIYATNEGQRDFEALGKKLEPKQAELKNLNDELEGLKKQLTTQGDKLSETARANLQKQIDQKQKTLERSLQDARDDAQGQQGEIGQKILRKMAPIIVKYASENGFGMILDTSNPWPQGPVLWNGPALDITVPVVDAYNAQSGVPAPAKPSAAKPAGSAPKPATPSTAKPQ